MTVAFLSRLLKSSLDLETFMSTRRLEGIREFLPGISAHTETQTQTQLDADV